MLQALATLSQTGESFDLFDLVRLCRERPFRVLRGLEMLRVSGLLHPRRLRLSLAGLAVAAACGAVRAPSARTAPRHPQRTSRAA